MLFVGLCDLRLRAHVESESGHFMRTLMRTLRPKKGVF